MYRGKDEVPGLERQKKVNSEGILGQTIFSPTNKTLGAVVKRFKTNIAKHSNLVQEQKTTEEYFKTGEMTFARRVMWSEWQSFNKHFERKSGLIILFIYLFDLFSNVAE